MPCVWLSIIIFISFLFYIIFELIMVISFHFDSSGNFLYLFRNGVARAEKYVKTKLDGDLIIHILITATSVLTS